MARLHAALEAIGKPVRQGANVTVYFSPTGVTPRGGPIIPARTGKVLRVDDDALVIEADSGETVALSWDHIVGLQVAAR